MTPSLLFGPAVVGCLMSKEMVVPPVRFGLPPTPFFGAEIFIQWFLDKVERGLIGGAETFDVIFVLMPDVPADLTGVGEALGKEFALRKWARLWPLYSPLLSLWYTTSLGELLSSLPP